MSPVSYGEGDSCSLYNSLSPDCANEEMCQTTAKARGISKLCLDFKLL